MNKFNLLGRLQKNSDKNYIKLQNRFFSKCRSTNLSFEKKWMDTGKVVAVSNRNLVTNKTVTRKKRDGFISKN